MKEVAIIGAGGHTRSLINLLEYNSFKILGIFDDSYQISVNEMVNGYPLMGKTEDYKANVAVVLSVGDNALRTALFYKYISSILRDNLIHPSAIVEKRVSIGISNQIFANAYLNSNVVIGDNNIINTGAIIEHEVKIGCNNHIAVNSTLCGRANIGRNCFIGAGAVIIDKISISDNVTIAANSVVIKDILEAGVYVGNPAKRLK